MDFSLSFNCEWKLNEIVQWVGLTMLKVTVTRNQIKDAYSGKEYRVQNLHVEKEKTLVEYIPALPIFYLRTTSLKTENCHDANRSLL